MLTVRKTCVTMDITNSNGNWHKVGEVYEVETIPTSRHFYSAAPRERTIQINHTQIVSYVSPPGYVLTEVKNEKNYITQDADGWWCQYVKEPDCNSTHCNSTQWFVHGAPEENDLVCPDIHNRPLDFTTQIFKKNEKGEFHRVNNSDRL